MATKKKTSPLVPCIVFDTETTGFPGEKGFFRARVIEVGAVVITADMRVVSPINFFVWQSTAHLEHPMAQRAMDVHGISAAQIQRTGLKPKEAATRLASWVERVQAHHGVTEARAYNQGFDFWFLKREPWRLFERTALVPGEDIKETMRQAMKAAGEGARAPALAKAVSFLVDRGHDLRWEGASHRAMEDARMAAMCALCLAKEAEDPQASLL